MPLRCDSAAATKGAREVRKQVQLEFQEPGFEGALLYTLRVSSSTRGSAEEYRELLVERLKEGLGVARDISWSLITHEVAVLGWKADAPWGSWITVLVSDPKGSRYSLMRAMAGVAARAVEAATHRDMELWLELRARLRGLQGSEEYSADPIKNHAVGYFLPSGSGALRAQLLEGLMTRAIRVRAAKHVQMYAEEHPGCTLAQALASLPAAAAAAAAAPLPPEAMQAGGREGMAADEVPLIPVSDGEEDEEQDEGEAAGEEAAGEETAEEEAEDGDPNHIPCTGSHLDLQAEGVIWDLVQRLFAPEGEFASDLFTDNSRKLAAAWLLGLLRTDGHLAKGYIQLTAHTCDVGLLLQVIADVNGFLELGGPGAKVRLRHMAQVHSGEDPERLQAQYFRCDIYIHDDKMHQALCELLPVGAKKDGYGPTHAAATR